MSHADRDPLSRLEEGDDEEVLDLNDPNMEIIDDGDDAAAAPAEDDDDDDDAEAQARMAMDEAEEEAAAAAAAEGEAPVEKEPERDDAQFYAATEQPLHALAVHPAIGALYAIAGEDDKVRIVQVPSGDDVLVGDDEGKIFVRHVLEGHTDTVTHAAFSPNGETLATGSMDCTVRLWKTATGELLHTLTDLSGEISVLLWHPSSLVLVGGAADAQAVLWNCIKGTVATYFSGHRGAVTNATWVQGMKKLLTVSADGSVIMFNPKTGEPDMTVVKDLSPDGAGISAMTMLSDDVCLVGCEDGSLHVVSLSKGKAVAHFTEVHGQAIESLCVNKELGFVVSTGCDCLVVVWRLHDYSVRTAFRSPEGVIKMTFCGALMVAACTDGDIRVWDSREADGEVRCQLMGHSKMVFDAQISADRKWLLSISDDGSTRAFAAAPILALI
jgi:WD40 repeat protein